MVRKILPKITFWKVVLAAILTAGLYVSIIRFTQGLGASTALSDKVPWGLWVGFDVLCGVALAAGGFTVTLIVYIFNIEKYKPITRSAVLSAFLGYMLVSVGLMYDIGRPYRIWHPLVMWNPHSVMFEVAWCVMLYTGVLSMEFSLILFEKLKWHTPLKLVKSISIPLVIAGVILSMLHQSSLGTVFLIAPGRLHPLWYTPILPLLFFISAVGAGFAMVIFESYLSRRAFKKRLELDILSSIGRVLVVILAVYLVLKMRDLQNNGALGLLLHDSMETRMFLTEMGFGVLLPLILLIIPKVRESQSGLFVASLLVVLGVVMNRLNVCITGMAASSGGSYFPSWMEITATLAIVAAGFVLFGLAVKYLPIFPEEQSVRPETLQYVFPDTAVHGASRGLGAEAEADN